MFSDRTIQKDMQWTGGASTRQSGSEEKSYGSFGMNYINDAITLNMNKSWFMFDDEIVALGSGIEVDPNFQTAVDFRKIKSSANNIISIDGVAQETGLTPLDLQGNYQWIYLEGDIRSSSRGYIFPNTQDVSLIKKIETTASWEAVNNFTLDYMSNPDVKYNNVSINLSHENNSDYAYIILPSTTTELVEGYVANPTITIISNTADAHVVKNTALNMTMANIWNASGVSLDSFDINGAASVILWETDTEMRVWISNPPRDEKTIDLTLNQFSGDSFTTAYPDQVREVASNQFSIDFAEGFGATLSFQLAK